MKLFFAAVILTASICVLNGCQNGRASVRVSSDGSDAAEPAMASDAKDHVYVAFVEHGPNKTADVFLQKFDRQLTPIGEKIRVNAEPGKATAWRGDPPTIAVGADGSIYIGWTASVEGVGASANDLYLSVSRDGGKSIGSAVKVNDDSTPAVHGMHSLAVGADGRVFVSWLDERYLHSDQQRTSHTEAKMSENMPMQHSEANREVYTSFSTDGGRSFSANQKVAVDACPCCKTALLVAPDGRVYLAWRQVLNGDFRHIAVAVSDNGGTSFSTPTIVSNDQWQIAACPVSGAALGLGENNSLEVRWYSAGEAGTAGMYASSSADGKSFSPRRLIMAGTVSGTPVFPGTGAVWSSAGDVLFEGGNDGPRAIAEGDLPSAALMDGKIYVGYIRSENNRRSIYLSRVQN